MQELLPALHFLCDLSKPLFACGLIYLFWVIGAFLSPGQRNIHVVTHKRDLADAWSKATTRSWSAPLFLLGFPLLFLVSLPMIMPLAAIGLGILFLMPATMLCS